MDSFFWMFRLKSFKQKFSVFLLMLLIFSQISKAENKLIMITADYCIYCMVWESEIGEIYPKSNIGKNYILKKIKIDEYNNNKSNSDQISVTPTFVFYQGQKEKGRIIGYTDPEMFWWQVDEITE